MKPIVIGTFLQDYDDAGVFSQALTAAGYPIEYLEISSGCALPELHDISALALMGGVMSVTDNLPWIAPTLQLIRDCDERSVPVIGHCLGGQLIAKALGGQVQRASFDEIGFHYVSVGESPLVSDHLGQTTERALVFEWHEDVFTVPPGATATLSGTAHHPHQGFVTDNGSMAFQCHIEIDEPMLRQWLEASPQSFDCDSPCIQPINEILDEVSEKCSLSRQFALPVYRRWMTNIKSETR